MRLRDRPAVHVVALLALAGAVLLPGLGQDLDFGSREARHAEIAREMVERGELVVPYLLGEPYTLKPPLYNLAVARLYALTGQASILWARLPSALAAAGLVLVTYALGRRWYNPRTALWAAAMLPAFALVLIWGRTARPDMMMAAWIGLGVLLADCSAAAPSPRASWLFWIGACLAVSAGTLSKGGQAVFFFAVAAVALWRARRRRWLPPLPQVGVALLLFLVVPVAWGLACEIRSPGYVRAILSYQFGTGLREHPKRSTLYLEEIWLVTAPWGAFAFGAAWAAVRRLKRSGYDRVVAPGLVVLACLACMTPVPNRRDHYMLPLMPFWALFLAAFLDRGIGASGEEPTGDVSPAIRRFLLVWPLRLCLLGFVAAALYAPFWWSSRVGRSTAWVAAGWACLAAGAVYGLQATLRPSTGSGRREPVERRGRLASAVTTLLVLCLALAAGAFQANRALLAVEPDPEVPMADEIVRAIPAGVPVGAFGVRSELLFFRLNRPVDYLPNKEAIPGFLQQPGSRYLILRSDFVPVAQAGSARPLRLVGTWRFVEEKVNLAVLAADGP